MWPSVAEPQASSAPLSRPARRRRAAAASRDRHGDRAGHDDRAGDEGGLEPERLGEESDQDRVRPEEVRALAEEERVEGDEGGIEGDREEDGRDHRQRPDQPRTGQQARPIDRGRPRSARPARRPATMATRATSPSSRTSPPTSAMWLRSEASRTAGPPSTGGPRSRRRSRGRAASCRSPRRPAAARCRAEGRPGRACSSDDEPRVEEEQRPERATRRAVARQAATASRG